MLNQDSVGGTAVAFSSAPSNQLNRTQIMRATAHCLRQIGYDGTTIRRIAAELDCSVGSIYRYFRDKRELLSAVTQQMLEPVAQAVENGEAWEQTVLLYHQHASRNLDCYQLMFWLANLGPEPQNQEPEQDTLTRTNRPAMLPKVVERILNGWTARWGSEDQARRAWAMLHGMIELGIDGPATLACVQTMVPAVRSPSMSAMQEVAMLHVLAPAAFETATSHPVAMVIPQEPAAADRLDWSAPVVSPALSSAAETDDLCML